MDKKLDTPDEKTSEAERLVRRSLSFLTSDIHVKGNKMEMVVGDLMRARALDPCNFQATSLLVNFCLDKGVSIRDAQITSTDIQMAYQNGFGEDLFCQVEFFREVVLKQSEASGGFDDPRIQALIEVLEAIVEVDPKPDIVRRLILLYRMIGKMREGLDLLLSVSERDVADSGPKYILACFHNHQYERLVYFYEAHQEFLDPVLDGDKRRMIAVAYERVCDQLSFRKTHAFSDESDFQKSLRMLKQAEYLYKMDKGEYDPDFTGEPYPTKDEILSLTNYGQIFTQQALLIENNQHFGLDLPDPTDLRNRSLSIFDHAMNRIGDRSRVSYWRKISNQVKINIVNACADSKLGIDRLNSAVEMAELLLGEDETDLPHRDVVQNNLAVLKRYQTLASSESLSFDEEEALHLRSLRGNWRDLVGYRALIGFYEHYGKVAQADYYRNLLEFSFLLKALIDLDRYQIDPGSSLVGNNEDSVDLDYEDENFKEQLKTFYDHIIESDHSVRDHFEPLQKVFKPFLNKYLDYLRSNSPEGSDISGRTKGGFSIVLKMLKEKKECVPQITDLLGFRVLTDTEEQAHELYRKVRGDMYDRPAPKEWITMDKPTKTGYRSMDVTGYMKDGKAQAQFQIRTKAIEAKIDKTAAHHDYYKVISGEKLSRQVDEDPIYYLELLVRIFNRITTAFNFIQKSEEDLSLHQTLYVYAHGELTDEEKEKLP